MTSLIRKRPTVKRINAWALFYMRQILLIGFLLVFPFFGMPQNLVPNGSFENYSDCPKTIDNFPLQYLADWSAPDWKDSTGYSYTHSPDFFHTCAKGKYSQPNNFLGHQRPFQGQGYAGIFVYKVQTREYLQVKLDTPLKKDHSYYIKLRVSMADYCTLAINKLGALLTNESDFLGYNKSYTPLQPLKGDPNRKIGEKEEWVVIAGCYKAQGKETFLNLGNFVKDDQTPRDWVKNTTDEETLKRGYYYVDEVSVFPCNTLEDCPCRKIGFQNIQDSLKTLANNEDSSKLSFVNLHFKTDQAKILNSSYKVLDHMTDFLKNHEHINLIIDGHTDNRGPQDYNKELSEQRAKAVFNYLVKKGIEKKRLKVRGFGAKQPIANNKTPRGRKLNRRVEFIIKPEKH